MHDRKNLTHLKWASRIVILLTAVFSVWANVLHIENVTAPAIIFAAAPPLVVLAAFELISRIPMRPNIAWWRRLPRPVVSGFIAAGGAWLSYWHQKAAIFRYNDGDEQNAAILPLLIDGLMIIASVCVIELNYMIRDLDMKLAGVELAKAKVQEKPKEKALTQRDRIAIAMQEMPWAMPKEIAASLTAAGVQVKESYVSNVMSELRKAQRTNGKAVSAHN